MTGNLGSMTAYALVRLCNDTLLNYGVAARPEEGTEKEKKACKKWGSWIRIYIIFNPP